MQADEVQNAKEPIAAQIDLSGQTLIPEDFMAGVAGLMGFVEPFSSPFAFFVSDEIGQLQG